MNESWPLEELTGIPCSDDPESNDPESNCTEWDGSVQRPVPQSSPYYMPWLQQVAWITIFGLMLFVAIVGNALVAWIVLGRSLHIFHFAFYWTDDHKLVQQRQLSLIWHALMKMTSVACTGQMFVFELEWERALWDQRPRTIFAFLSWKWKEKYQGDLPRVPRGISFFPIFGIFTSFLTRQVIALDYEVVCYTHRLVLHVIERTESAASVDVTWRPVSLFTPEPITRHFPIGRYLRLFKLFFPFHYLHGVEFTRILFRLQFLRNNFFLKCRQNSFKVTFSPTMTSWSLFFYLETDVIFKNVRTILSIAVPLLLTNFPLRKWPRPLNGLLGVKETGEELQLQCPASLSCEWARMPLRPWPTWGQAVYREF